MSHFGFRLIQIFDRLLFALLILAGARTVLLLLNFPIIPVPYLDSFLWGLWELLQGIMRQISNSPYLPRFM